MATTNPNIQFQILNGDTSAVEGELDIYNPTKFPLALTFTIKDVMDMTSSKGSFSKSFKIPATDNNNDVLKFLISDSFANSHEFVEGKKARIFCDGNLVLEGAFQVKGHGVDKFPDYYECLVFGDNYKWVNALDKLNLCDIDFDAGNYYPNTPSIIQFGRDNIMDTWEYDMAAQEIGGVGTHVVYPLINTGKWTYGDFAHPDDMAPAIWIYDMVKVMLAKQGYTLQSDFMETDWFKKLISITPRQSWENDDAILEQYQFEYEQTGGWTDWKTPWDFRTAGLHESEFKGPFTNMEVVCPTCDPSSLITDQTWHDGVMELWPMINDFPKNTYMGWYWGSGTAACQPMNDQNLTRMMTGPCNDSQFLYVGSEWHCVWDNAAPLAAGASPTSGHVENFTNDARFQTSFMGTYEFNGECLVEMDNDAVIDNIPEPYDPFVNQSHPYNGFGYGHCGGMLSQTEGEDLGTVYRATLFVMHYKESTGRVHPHVVDTQHSVNYDNLLHYGWYCTGTTASELPSSATGNLKFELSFKGVEIEILDPEDYVYYYVEVVEEKHNEWWDAWSGGGGVIGRTQCKYRMSGAKMNGGLTEQIVDGGSVSLGHLLPCDVSQLEWLNGLTGLFNLYWQADEMTKTIYVEPRDNFFEGADTAIDWSDKLDWGQKQTAKYVYDALKRDLCFTYENDGSDGFVEERNRRKGQVCELGSHVMDLGELYVNEESRIGSNYYAPTYMFRDKVISTNNSNAVNIPVIHSEYSQIWSTSNNNDYPDKIDEHIPRVLLWGGKTPLNHADGFSSSNKWRWGKTNPSSTPDELDYYPFAGVYCDEDETYFGSLTVGTITYYPQLYFQGVEANMVQPAPATWTQIAGLYEVFWERNIENLITRPKIKTAMFKLTAQDISDLKFQKLIYIENSEGATYWIINKVVDYKPAENNMTKVELFEWTLAKPRKRTGSAHPNRLGQGLGPTSDSGIGQIGTNKNRLEKNYAGKLGITNIKRFQTQPTPNLSLTNPIIPNKIGAEDRKTAYPTRPKWSNMDTSGAKTTTRNDKTSFNIGNDNVVKQNNTGIVIGNNNTSGQSNGIVIGNNNNRWSVKPNPIEFVVGGKNPALVISSTGRVLEGGGGNVVFVDASGNYQDVWVEIIEGFDTAFVKLLKSR